MTTPRLHVGSRLARVEDPQLLRGDARFCDDIELPRMLHAAILRSPVAHGTLRGIDRTGLTAPVTAVFGPELAWDRTGPVEVVWRQPNSWQDDRPLVDRTVRYVGEPVGVVVSSSRYEAEDALDEVVVDIEPLAPVITIDDALSGATLLYPEAGTNVFSHWTSGDDPGLVDAVFAAADHTLSIPMSMGRVIGAPMEGRGIVVDPGRRPGDKITIWTSTQAPHAVRDCVAEVCRIPQHRIRVIAPDVGGGFGVKDHIYEDELLVVLAAIELGRPVKWIEDRWESLVTTAQARDERYTVDVAFDDDGRLRGLRVDAIRNCGALLNIFGAGPLFTLTGTVPGPYRWDAVSCRATAVATTTTPTAAYRGFGQTQSTYVRERAVDIVAHHLGMDPVELRLANLIQPDELPYPIRTVPTTYDNGDYPEALRLARTMAEAWEAPEDDGRTRGTGYATYVQMAGVGPSQGNPHIGLSIGSWESTTLRMERDGTVRAYVGVSPHGQGHATTFSQLIADRLGVDPSSVELIYSDTDVTPYSSYGTAASRSIAVGGGATVRAADQLASRIRQVAAEMLEAAPEDIVLANGRATVAGTRIGHTIGEVANRAWQGWALPDGLDAGLVEHAVYEPEEFTYSYASHVCRVAVDPDTGIVEVERYAVASDCGTIVNPTIVEGQTHGGVAQGLGPAILEHGVVDEDGQPRTTTFLDYLLPTASDVPDIEIAHLEHPSPYTPGGMKGMGEGGTNGGFACVMNAVAAALGDANPRATHAPLTPTVVWELLRSVATGPPDS